MVTFPHSLVLRPVGVLPSLWSDLHDHRLAVINVVMPQFTIGSEIAREKVMLTQFNEDEWEITWLSNVQDPIDGLRTSSDVALWVKFFPESVHVDDVYATDGTDHFLGTLNKNVNLDDLVRPFANDLERARLNQVLAPMPVAPKHSRLRL